ncbi:MAG: hypothetical protein RL885_28465 [Planctomycetota bacterium]
MFSVDRSSAPYLLRAFQKLEHAEDLAFRGRVRFVDVHYYKDIEDPARRDGSEGSGQLRVPSNSVETLHIDSATGKTLGSTFAPGYLNFGSTYIHPVYALCMSGPGVDLSFLRRKMGRYVVRIRDPERLVDDVVESLQECPIPDREVFFVHLLPVEYKKGLVGAKPDDTVRLSYAQKPPDFVDECEYRLVIGVSGVRPDVPVEFFLTLRSAGEYCELLRDAKDGRPT